MKTTRTILSLISVLLLFILSAPPQAQPVTVPDLNTGTFQNTDMDPYFLEADKSDNQAQWEHLVSMGLNDLSAHWEAAALAEIEAQVFPITNIDEYNSTPEYRAYLKRELAIQKDEDFAKWEAAAYHAIQRRRNAFLDELTRRKREATAADRQAFEESQAIIAHSPDSSTGLEDRINQMEAGWSGLFAQNIEAGLMDYSAGLTVLEQDYVELQQTLIEQNAEYQTGLLEIKRYENRVRSALSNSVVQLEAMLGTGGIFAEEVCDPDGNNCAMQINSAGQDLQSLLNDLKDSLTNEAPLSTLARQMVTFLQAQKLQAQTTADSWTAQTRDTLDLSHRNILAGNGVNSAQTYPIVGAIQTFVNSNGANNAALKGILESELATGLTVESISGADVCGAGHHEPYFVMVGVYGANECYSTVGDAAYTFDAQGAGGWAGVPIIVGGTFNETELHLKGTYVIYDANADANARTWQNYTFELDGFLDTWNDLLPALTNWEAQSAAYEADYAAWQTNANAALRQAATAYETGATELVGARSKWLLEMENIYREGENDWRVMRRELKKKQDTYRAELERKHLNPAELERELDRRSLAVLKKMNKPTLPGAQNIALETTLKAHSRFEDIKSKSLRAAERIDSSRMDDVLGQFDKSISGALNITVMETLNQAAIDSRQAMVDQMSAVLEDNLGKSVQQTFQYNEVLSKARTTLGITDAMFANGFDGLSEKQKEALENEVGRIFADEYQNDAGFSVSQNANGNITVTRVIPTGNSIQIAGTDGTRPEHYKPELREESFVVTGPAAMKLVKTDELFNTWDLEELLGKFGKAQKSYDRAGSKDVGKILNRTIKNQGEILADRVDDYHANTQKRMETAQMLKSIVESMLTGGLDFKAAATNYAEGQVRGTIAAAVAEATGLPSEFISGLMGGQKPHEAAVSMVENIAWQNFETATGIEGISSLARTALANERSRKAEKKSKRLRVEDFATLGTTYAVRNQQYSGGLQSMLSLANLTTGFLYTPLQNAYQNSLTKQGGGAFSSLVNDSLNGFTGNVTTMATALTTGRAPTQSQLQSLTGLPAEYFHRLPGQLKPASDRTDVYGRLGTRNLGRWVDRVVDEGTKFGQDLASGAYFADSIGGKFGDTLKRRNSADFATAEDLTNAMFNPLDYIIKPMYEAMGMGRTYDNFWAPYKKFTRKGKEKFRDALAKNPAALDITAFAAANVTGCLQCYYGYAWQKGWNQGGNKGAVAEVGTVVAKGLGALALGPGALSGGPAGMVTVKALLASLDAGASYSYENGWDVKLGLADPTGKLSTGLTYSDQNGVGVYADVSATKSKHGASLGFSYTEGGGLSLNAGGKRGSFNAGISYSTTNGFGVTGGYTDNLGVLNNSLNGATGNLSFGLSQRGGWDIDATFSPEKAFDAKYLKDRGTSLGIGYYNRPGQGGGFTASGAIKGFSLKHDLKSGRSTLGDFSQLIRTLTAEKRENEMRKKRLAEISKRIGRDISADEWKNMSQDEQDKVLEEVEKAAKKDSNGSEGESYETDRGLLGDLLNAAKDGLVGMFGGISDKWGYVDAQGKYHTRTCFVAGTLVVTETGFRPIETIKAGDMVLSWNEKSGELGFNKVAQTFVRSTELIYQIAYEDGTFLETTWNHPFYIKGKGWVKAKDLRNGDLSLTSASIRGDSRELRVASVVIDEREDRVYNFEVSRDHTYFVTGMGVLVHNDSKTYKVEGNKLLVNGKVETPNEEIIEKMKRDDVVQLATELNQRGLTEEQIAKLKEFASLDVNVQYKDGPIAEEIDEVIKELNGLDPEDNPLIGKFIESNLLLGDLNKRKALLEILKTGKTPAERKSLLQMVRVMAGDDLPQEQLEFFDTLGDLKLTGKKVNSLLKTTNYKINDAKSKTSVYANAIGFTANKELPEKEIKLLNAKFQKNEKQLGELASSKTILGEMKKARSNDERAMIWAGVLASKESLSPEERELHKLFSEKGFGKNVINGQMKKVANSIKDITQEKLTINKRLDTAKIRREKANAIAAQTCRMQAVFIYDQFMNQNKHDNFREFYKSELKKGLVSGSTLNYHLRSFGRANNVGNGDTPISNTNIWNLHKSSANVATAWVARKHGEKPGHFLTIYRATNGVWRFLDHTQSATPWRKKVDWRLVHKLYYD